MLMLLNPGGQKPLAMSAPQQAGLWLAGAAFAEVVELGACDLPARSAFGHDVVPLLADLVVRRPLTVADPLELVVDLTAERGRRHDHEHDAEECGDDRHHRA